MKNVLREHPVQRKRKALKKRRCGRIAHFWLIGVDDFPNDYPDKHIKFGSFARNTKIRPLDDIDLMYCLGAGNA
ncbi:MAG: hypothetical protein ABR572_08815, partial [Cryomorphaceae bacterium]